MGDSYYERAAVCTRGHVETAILGARQEAVASRCETCGAKVLTACPNCEARIRGFYMVPGFIGGGDEYKPPQFCDGCGQPFPWLDRQGRIYLLENMLDEEQLDPADELEAREQLRALAEPELEDQDAERRWKTVKRLAPGLWEKAGGQEILQSVVSASIKGSLGL
jgi:hypothetical protein